ncbi:MAG TPA: MFS transporter [Pseudogracilibacillus sp.]|nr:MFS transporter [Pseudogracilibacillus sp.]
MWFANFFIASSMTMILPFISLHIDTLGNFSDSYVQTWSGLIFGVTFVTAFIFSPIWGKIGDKYGRRNILIMSATGLGISLLLMGFATSVMQLFILRLFMGIFTGFIPMSQAFISTQTPKETAGKVLGTLQTASVTGTLMGPLIGGWIADGLSYGTTFKLVSISIFLSALIVAFGIKELKVKVTNIEDQQSYTSKEVIKHIVGHPVLLIVLLTSTLVQVAHFSIQPILSLYVVEINGPENIAFYSGLTFSVAGLGSLFLARYWGQLGDKYGHTKILIGLLFLAGIAYFPGAFVTNIWQLIFLRFILGIAIGGIVPTRVAYIRLEAPLAMQGEVLGYNTSLRFLGNMVGPALGGTLAAHFGMSSIFFVTSSLLILTASIILVAWAKYESDNRKFVFFKH